MEKGAYSVRPRVMMSRCPFDGGSNEPAYSARRGRAGETRAVPSERLPQYVPRQTMSAPAASNSHTVGKSTCAGMSIDVLTPVGPHTGTVIFCHGLGDTGKARALSIFYSIQSHMYYDVTMRRAGRPCATAGLAESAVQCSRGFVEECATLPLLFMQ